MPSTFVSRARGWACLLLLLPFAARGGDVRPIPQGEASPQHPGVQATTAPETAPETGTDEAPSPSLGTGDAASEEEGGSSGSGWTGRASGLELRASVGLQHWDARTEMDGRQLPAGVSLAGGMVFTLPLSDRLQLAITHQLLPSLTLGLGAGEDLLHGSITSGFSAAGFSSIEGIIAGGFLDLDGGLRVVQGVWLVGGVSVDAQRLGLDRSMLTPGASAGLVLVLHPLIRLQLGIEGRQSLGFGGVINPLTQLQIGSVLGQGARPLPLLEVQIWRDVSLDAYANHRWILGSTQTVQSYLLGLTWRSR